MPGIDQAQSIPAIHTEGELHLGLSLIMMEVFLSIVLCSPPSLDLTMAFSPHNAEDRVLDLGTLYTSVYEIYTDVYTLQISI